MPMHSPRPQLVKMGSNTRFQMQSCTCIDAFTAQEHMQGCEDTPPGKYEADADGEDTRYDQHSHMIQSQHTNKVKRRKQCRMLWIVKHGSTIKSTSFEKL